MAGGERRFRRSPRRELAGGLTVIEARGLGARMLGAIGIDAWPQDQALLIPRCSALHTAGVRFPVDLIWLDGSGRVVLIDRGVPPWRTRVCRGARAVIETAAGAADAFVAAGAADSGAGAGAGAGAG